MFTTTAANTRHDLKFNTVMAILKLAIHHAGLDGGDNQITLSYCVAFTIVRA